MPDDPACQQIFLCPRPDDPVCLAVPLCAGSDDPAMEVAQCILIYSVACSDDPD
jgi:hypothetical protein